MGWNLLTRRRDELPEMRWSLVVLAMAVTCLCGGAVPWLCETAVVLAVPSLVLSVTAYTMLILLWRRLAAVGVSTGIGAVVLLTGGGWFWAVCFAVCLLAVAYVYASLYMAREPRFVRIASGASAAGICGLLVAVAWISGRFDTLGEAIVFFCDRFRDSADVGLQALYGAGNADSTVILLPETINAMLYQVVAAVPALAGMGCILFAWVCDGVIRLTFMQLDCREYFTADGDDGITIPRSFGVLYGVFLFLVMGTSASGSPYLYSILSNCHWIFALPCAWVGLCAGYRKLRHALAEASFYGTVKTHSPLPALFVMVFFVLLLGVSVTFTVLAVLGAVRIIRRRKTTEQ
ncbi:MAG: hypothetical protein IKY52_03705 [Clostridia bacterium]|nr:hypothetical protein [Clostridia bacterium]